MSSLQDIADSLIRIAYMDKEDRYSWIPLLANKLKSVPSGEISNEQRELMLEILNSLGEEIFYAQKAEAEAIGEVQKQAKPKKAKATKTLEVEPQPKVIEVVEPKVDVEEATQVVIGEPEVVVPKTTPKAKRVAKPKPTPKAKPQPIKDLSFLDDIDSAF